jgi:hypothetical protein
MYQEWRQREDKIALKRRELELEEDKMKNITVANS